ncbi:septal ring lytic transglycosylase RlpA family protein [Volucribacter amazonae]|uniref:Endolytic peptidoglycan transglycosylase RlpA n=1 Tax=Volucribacter amazonae TaxID=256731 RepID=A0A9X4PCJ1_9PAST|nr:septal ring lytic transglycosylase RlpA family protein [Volucribacter amazonae]MDG6895762.1 hypothetical protein [Volucribacter amazonae]
MTKSNKILTILLAFLFVSSPTLYAKSETKTLYGITGAKLDKQTSLASPTTYQVKGKSYTTKATDEAKNYSKVGTASYYHSKFNGRKTSNGETYNQMEFTAAHKTLPINSYALVTNLTNNRKVIVRINDRGPFVNSRLIDLSRAAAKEIGMLGAGLAKVKIEALHVDRAGKISGAGVDTLAKQAKDTSRLVLGETSTMLANNASKATGISSKQPSATLVNTDRLVATQNSEVNKSVASNYAVRMKNLESENQAQDLVEKLAMKNVKTEITQVGEEYEVLFTALNSQRDINQIKQKLNQLDNAQSVSLYTYSY